MANHQSLDTFLQEETPAMAQLLKDITDASKKVEKQTRKAGLAGILGAQGTENIQGEQQQKLDVIADEIFIEAFQSGNTVCGIASEENDDFIAFKEDKNKNAEYVVCFDPLDGSSNIDVNVSIGTIFAIFKRVSPVGSEAVLEDFLQTGTELVCSGYVLYGTSTMLVYTTNNGVNGFTLNPEDDIYYLSHADMKAPENGRLYSINEGNMNICSEGLRQYVETTRDMPKPFSGRYIGSLVADFHRNLIKGGIYIYPTTKNDVNGKLRLLYECAPLAHIIEQAGGKASDGKTPVMDIVPGKLHQRIGYFVGSKTMMEKAEACIAEFG